MDRMSIMAAWHGMLKLMSCQRERAQSLHSPLPVPSLR